MSELVFHVLINHKSRLFFVFLPGLCDLLFGPFPSTPQHIRLTCAFGSIRRMPDFKYVRCAHHQSTALAHWQFCPPRDRISLTEVTIARHCRFVHPEKNIGKTGENSERRP